MRGDHTYTLPESLPLMGPPPRARGPRRAHGDDAGGAGTTPAWAGTTTGSPAFRFAPVDHPRVRGDHRSIMSSVIRSPGPPPRARGPPGVRRVLLRRAGTTPACAGTTHQLRRGSRPLGDHPRVRGDHEDGARGCLDAAGPPPRARGPRKTDTPLRCRHGTTPACAGTTPWLWRTAWTGWDHPRVRGDHRRAGGNDRSRRGPPPRARGPLGAAEVVAAVRGTTPACAGTTPSKSSALPWLGDHPRVRGDHLAYSESDFRLMGPPPRARGPRRLVPG